MEDRARTKRLPDGTTLRVNFTGEQKPAKKPKVARGPNLKVGDYVKPIDESTRGVIRKVERGIFYVELEDDSSALHRYSRRELEKLKGR